MGQPGGARRTALAAIVVLGAAGVSLLRQPGAGALDTVYAEDGSIFLASAYTDPAVFTPYAGYLHLVPRLLALGVAQLPVSAAAAGLAIAAALVTGLLALLVFVASAGHFSSIWARVLVSSVVVLVPVGQDELPNSIANLHWPALYALFWVLLWRPVSRAGRAVAIVAVLLIALSDLLAVIFAPLALWLWWRRRSAARSVTTTDESAAPAASSLSSGTGASPSAVGVSSSIRGGAPASDAARHSFLLGLVLAVGLVGQAAAVLLGPSGRELNPEPVLWAPWWVLRAVPTGVLGQRWFGSEIDMRWLALAAVAWLLVVGAVVFALRRDGRWRLPSGWRLAVLAIVHCVALYALPVALSGQATPRYAAGPAMLLIVALAALLFTANGRPSPKPMGDIHSQTTVWAAGHVDGRAVPKAAVALMVFCAVVWLANLRIPNERAEGPLWTDEVRQAEQSCGADNSTVDIALAPAGWKMKVPCRVVTAWE